MTIDRPEIPDMPDMISLTTREDPQVDLDQATEGEMGMGENMSGMSGMSANQGANPAAATLRRSDAARAPSQSPALATVGAACPHAGAGPTAIGTAVVGP